MYVCFGFFFWLLFFNGHKRGTARLPLLLAAVFLAVTSDTTVSSPHFFAPLPSLPFSSALLWKEEKKKVHTVFRRSALLTFFDLLASFRTVFNQPP